MSDLISRSALLDSVQKFCGDYFIHGGNAYDKAAVEIAVKAAPTVDAVRVVHGYWTPANYKPTRYDKCSICGKRKTIEEEFVYCPNCGAKMDGERKEGKA